MKLNKKNHFLFATLISCLSAGKISSNIVKKFNEKWPDCYDYGVCPDWDYGDWMSCYAERLCVCNPSTYTKSRIWNPLKATDAKGDCPLPRTEHDSKGLFEVVCEPCTNDFNNECQGPPAPFGGRCVLQKTSTTTKEIITVSNKEPKQPAIDVKELIVDALIIGVVGTAIEKVISEHSDTATTENSELSAADIAGIVVGCVVFVGLWTAGSVFIYKSYKKDENQVKKEHENKANESDQSEKKTDKSLKSFQQKISNRESSNRFEIPDSDADC